MIKLTTMKKKLIIYDHQRLYLDCMHLFLSENLIAKNFDIIEVYNFDELKNFLSEKESLLLFNVIGFQSIDLVQQIENFLHLNDTLKIVVHSANSDIRVIKKLYDRGVKSYLGSKTSSKEFFEAVKRVTEGEIYISEDTKNALINSICNTEEKNERKRFVIDDITAREKDVLLLVCEGLRSKEIAEKLFISTHTVDSHRRNMMLKFSVNSSSKLVKFAMENKLIEY